MMIWDAALTVGLALMAAYLPLSILLTLQIWESRRYVRSNLNSDTSPGPAGRAAVIVPVKGVDLELAASLRALLQQDYPDYEVHFVGEDDQDPAFAVVSQLIAEGPACRVQWHSAGRATDCGQKVHNLLVACEHLADDVDLVAFMDSDASPSPTWLADLASRLPKDDAKVGAVTGYRVCVPEGPGVANWLQYSINSAVGAMLVGRSPLNLVWGGSWMIRRSTFDESGLAQAWRGTLSDDVVASGHVRSSGQRVIFEPRITVPSATRATMPELVEFLRRQFFMARHYSNDLWRLVLVGWTLAVVAFWFNAGLALAGAITGAPRWWAPAALAVVCYGLGVVRGLLRIDISRRSLPDHQDALRSAQRFDVLTGPLGTLVGWLGLASSAVGRQVTWRNIRYRLDSAGQVKRIEHLQQAPEQSPASGAKAA